MPLLAPEFPVFLAIPVQMFWKDRAPAHFHVRYAEFQARIDISTLEVISGELPRRALVLVLEWAQEHRAELMEDWNLCSQSLPPKKIVPLA